MKGCFGAEVNLSMYERLLRVVVGGLLVSSVMFDKPFQVAGWTLYAAAAAGAVLVVTGVVGNCPLYSFLDRMAEKAEKPKKEKAKRSSSRAKTRAKARAKTSRARTAKARAKTSRKSRKTKRK